MGDESALDYLTLFAEIGIAYAAALAIFVAFARGEARFSPPDSLRVRAVMILSFTVVLSSCFPLVLTQFPFERTEFWSLASVGALGLNLFNAYSIASNQIPLSMEDQLEVGIFNSIFSWGLAIGTLGCLAVNTARVLGTPGPALYLLSMFLLLTIATSNFVTLAFRRML